MFRFSRLVSFLLFFFAAIASARAQWLVYELRFQEEAGSVNFSFYTGAYVVAPLKGGAASIVFTTETGGNFYAAAENSMRYYMAVNKGVQQAVLSAFTINGTAQAFYSASGYLTTTVDYVENGVTRTMSVPSELAGMLLASDDESNNTPAADGSRGMIGRASIKGVLRRDLTDITNQTGFTMHDAMASITTLLEKYNYHPDTGDSAADAGAADTAATTTSTQASTATASDVSALFGSQQTETPTASLAPSSAVALESSPSLLPAVRQDED